MHARPGVDVLLPVVRQAICKAADQRVRHHPAGGDAAVDHIGFGRLLGEGMAAAASPFAVDVAVHEEPRRDDVQLFADVPCPCARSPGPCVRSRALCARCPASVVALRLGRLILEAAYEGTLLAALLHGLYGATPIVYLTLLGGGAFGNERQWIQDSIRTAIDKVPGPIVRIVSYREPESELLRLACRRA